MCRCNGRIVDTTKIIVNAPAEAILEVVSKLGSETSWLCASELWQLRGLLEDIVGGVGVQKDKGSLLIQSAVLEPSGLLGSFYWYAILPLHNIVFAGLCNSIVERATQVSTDVTKRVRLQRKFQ